MFDDRLFDIIMAEMMSEFGADVRTDEGSLAYNACVKIAEKLEEVYGDMDELNDNISLLTKDLLHLIDYGAERGIEYKYATAPIVRAKFSGEQEIGERFVCNDFVYTITEKITDFEYKMICDTEGVSANANFGTLEPEEYIENFSGGEIIEILTLGTEDEDEEVYRQRLITAKREQAFGGNKADYRSFINKIDGVGGCKPQRRTGANYLINITVISSDFSVPSDELINDIQEKVDPTQNSGEGDGKAPICHIVRILPVDAVSVSISTNIVYENDVDDALINSKIESVIKEYLLELREKWEASELNDLIVRLSQIDARILNVAGVSDIFETKINGAAENLAVSYDKIPAFGGVEIV